MNAHPRIVLASTSVYRQRLLTRLGVDFHTQAPGVDETPKAGETPEALALRLSAEKARAVSALEPGALIIGSDQVAALGDELLGKPGSIANACNQLQRCSGQRVMFYTAVSLMRDSNTLGQCCVPTEVVFRVLGGGEIGNYVEREMPLDCAGSFRWEGLGIALFESLSSDDPTALEGLPLIATASLLREENVNPLNTAI